LDGHATEARTLLPASVAAVLGRRIVTGDLTPGTTLPNLERLADQFAISRLSMREAIKLLVGKGLLSSAPRRGTVVRPRNEWSWLDADVLIWQIGEIPNAAFIRNLFELRRMIEPEAAALAAERASGAALAEIEHAFAQMAASEACVPELIKADVAFHQAVLKGTGNEFIAALSPAIETSLVLAFTIQRDALPDPQNLVISHGAILDAIQRGDSDAARKAVNALLARAEVEAFDGIRLHSTPSDIAQDARSVAEEPAP
jgi:DNA-binding FadR family transcriptional regulator